MSVGHAAIAILAAGALMRVSTFSCDRTSAGWPFVLLPAFEMASLPPVWSGWKCVFSTQRIGLSDNVLMAARTRAEFAARPVSTTRHCLVADLDTDVAAGDDDH